MMLSTKKLHIPVPVAFKAGEEVVVLPIEKLNQLRVSSYEKNQPYVMYPTPQ
jgi:hypothetical protein